MTDKKIILIADGKLHLSRSFSMDLSEIFPADLKFSNRVIFWEVKGKYKEGTILLHVVDYNPSDYTNFGRQKVSKPITRIKFENLNWNELQHFLWSWNNTTQKHIENHFDSIKSRSEIKHYDVSSSDKTTNYVPDFILVEKREPIQRTVYENFEILYKDATIKNGAIVFEKKLSWYYSPICFEIVNSFLKEEFDSIKYYFGKAINRSKRFSVQATLVLIDGIVENASASSPEIEQINDELIDLIKKHRIQKVINIQRKNEKSLLEADELFESLDGKNKNLLNQTSEEVINEVITWDGIRNGKQLQYLSGLKQSKDKKILFSLKPHFGFMFTINGLNKNYYCWELLDSHATYVWTIDEEITAGRIEEIINHVQEGGRNNYKQQYKAGLIDQDIKFNVLIHSTKTEDDPFTEWKLQLENIIK